MCINTVNAQVTSRSLIQFKKTYSINSDAGGELCDGSELQLKVTDAGNKILCIISIDGKNIVGYLADNSDLANKDTKNLFAFFLPNHNTVSLNIKFYREDGIDKAEIYNEDYFQKFKPCFDRKNIILTIDER